MVVKLNLDSYYDYYVHDFSVVGRAGGAGNKAIAFFIQCLLVEMPVTVTTVFVSLIKVRKSEYETNGTLRLRHMLRHSFLCWK